MILFFLDKIFRGKDKFLLLDEVLKRMKYGEVNEINGNICFDCIVIFLLIVIMICRRF